MDFNFRCQLNNKSNTFSLAFALVLARVKKLESELISLDGNLQTLLKNVKQVEERKEHIKRQLNNAKLQTTHLKSW